MKDLIKRLAEACGPSSREEGVAAIIEEEVRPYADDLRRDALGNLIVVKRGEGARIMVAAHMDEIGIIVTDIDEKGFVRFAPVGVFSPFILLGGRVTFQNGVIGVVGTEKLEEMKDLKFNKMFIDVGASSREEASRWLKIGDMACLRRPLEEVGNRLVGKSLDDRIGCAVAVEALRRLKPGTNEIYFVFTVQEEVGRRGAYPAAFTLEPDMALAVDVTLVGDTPEPPQRMSVSLGKGPAIKVMDTSLITHPRVKELLTRVAEDHGIPYQYEILERGGTDAGSIHLTRTGVPSGVISIPCRYVHSPSEMVDMRDVEGAVNLLVKTLEAPVKETLS